jgi:hypothetical protein
MYFHERRSKTLLCGLLFYFSLTRAQDTPLQSIFSLSIFSSQKPCAQACFINGPIDGCFADAVGDALMCVNDDECGLGTRGLAPNSCYCRTDLQSVAESFLTSCVGSACTVGDSSVDISSAGSIYGYYCSSLGFLVSAASTTTRETSQATTTTRETSQATITAYVTVYRSSATSSVGLAPSTAVKLWGLLSFVLVHISDVPCAGPCPCLYSFNIRLFIRAVSANTFLLQSLIL